MLLDCINERGMYLSTKCFQHMYTCLPAMTGHAPHVDLCGLSTPCSHAYLYSPTHIPLFPPNPHSAGSLARLFTTALPAGADLPEKRLKVWATHTSSQFLEERAILFENYLKKLCMVKEVAGSELFVGFLATNRVSHVM